MTRTPPLLPETTFPPLDMKRLDSMIDKAISHPQFKTAGNVVAFRPLQHLAFGSGMAAMAASIMLALMFSPQTSLTSMTAPTDLATSTSDVGDMLLFDSISA